MALIKIITEIQEVMPNLVSNLNNNSRLPKFDSVEEKYLLPLVGAALRDDLQTKYDNDTLSADELILVKHIRLLIAAYGYLDDMALINVAITDEGVRETSTTDMPAARAWVYKDLKSTLQTKVCDATEVLLSYMWRKKADLGLWTASDAYKQFEGLLIRTGIDFSDQYRLYQPMRNFYALKTLLRDQQDAYIVSGIGQELLDYFLTLANPTDEEAAIIKQLKKALAFFTIKHTVDHYSIRYSDSGFTVVAAGDPETDDSGRGGATAAGIKRLKDACDRDAKNFMSRAKKLAADWYNGAASADYKTAFAAGPLYKALTACEHTSGNEKRKIFRF